MPSWTSTMTREEELAEHRRRQEQRDADFAQAIKEFDSGVDEGDRLSFEERMELIELGGDTCFDPNGPSNEDSCKRLIGFVEMRRVCKLCSFDDGLTQEWLSK